MRRGQPNAAHFHRTYSRPLIKRHMILVGYQRSIRQICRSPYIETTISLPFVGMIGRSLPLLVPGMPIFDFAKWFGNTCIRETVRSALPQSNSRSAVKKACCFHIHLSRRGGTTYCFAH